MTDYNINIYKNLLEEFQTRSSDLDKLMNNVIISAHNLEQTYTALKITHNNIQRNAAEKYDLTDEN